MRLHLAPKRWGVYFAVIAILMAGMLIRTSYSVLAPGRALDLRSVVSVAGHQAPATHYYLTDVAFIPDANLFGLLAGLQPGWEIVPSDQVVPAGVDDAAFDRQMTVEMNGSQRIAAYVAERAAGLEVGNVRARIFVWDVLPDSHASGVLHQSDMMVAIDGRPVADSAAVAAILSHRRAGERVSVTVRRAGHRVEVVFATIALGGRARLGVRLVERPILPSLPLAVNYAIANISGSSGGLMFALDVYRSLRPARRSPAGRIAGTGTLDARGDVGEVDGTRQKLIAAQRAGATMFLVPARNVRD
ncbi:MAG TPA: PDZ domain-containing protein, partial [Candidatus Baltobacteraceae bacterium]